MEDYFNLTKQIRHLVIDKSVMVSFKELGEIKKILRDNSYHYFVNCSKIKQAEFFEPNLLMYKTALFEEWCGYFEMDRKARKHIVNNLLDFELTINSRVVNYISQLMSSKNLTDYERNEIILIVSQMRNRSEVDFSSYKGQKSWYFISKMTFGEMKRLVFWLYEVRRDFYFEVVEGYPFLNKDVKKRFDELNRLRNNLFHLTPLSIYLTERDHKRRKKIVKLVSKLSTSQEMKKVINEICFYADNYVKIKNSLRK